MAEHKPQGSQAPDKPVPTHAASTSTPTPQRAVPGPESAQRPDQPAPSPQSQPGQSQKSQILDYFRSQGAQPDDVIWTFQGLSLRLKDLG
jgi:hypothetical protein